MMAIVGYFVKYFLRIREQKRSISSNYLPNLGFKESAQ
jgi:hypothetical protein